VFVRVEDDDDVGRAGQRPRDGVFRPRRRDARVHHEDAASPPQPQHAFDARAVQPRRRPGIPAPAAAARVRRPAVDVTSHHIRFRLVAGDLGRSTGVVDGVEHVEQLRCFVSTSEFRQSHHHPDSGVRILPAVFPHTRRVALDVAGVLGGGVKGRLEEQDQLGAACDEVRADGVHRALGIPQRDGAREHGPRLRDRIHAAFVVLRRAERRAVIVIPASIPLAIPGQCQL